MYPLALGALKRLLVSDAAVTRCQRCQAELAVEHEHIVNVRERTLVCVCPGCYGDLWYASSNAEWRAVPHRYRELPSTALADTDWEAVDVPVGIAFFFYNSALQRVVAMYPSPVGVTESSLASTALERALEAAGRDIEPDVEALLVRRTRDASELFIVPIDACYELAGRVRMHWRGFGGGEETRNAIDAFFAMLRDRAVLSAGGDAN